MKSCIFKKWALFLVGIATIVACGPKEIESDPGLLSAQSKEWIPFEGDETVTFTSDEDTLRFEGTGKTTFFDKVRIMSDQSGFFKIQEDYYAKLERQELIFESPTSRYFMRYYLEKSKGETGEWDMIHISLADGDYYKNEIRILVFETDDFAKAETYEFKPSVNLNGITFHDIYYLKQERRPFELYFSKTQGIVGFKISANELFTIQ